MQLGLLAQLQVIHDPFGLLVVISAKDIRY